MTRYYIQFNGKFIRDYSNLSAARKFYNDKLAKDGATSIIRLIDTAGNIIESNQ